VQHALANALLRVDRSEACQKKKDSLHIGHYAFLDPIILISSSSLEKCHCFIAAWACVHMFLIINMNGGSAISNNSWHDFLEMISTGVTHYTVDPKVAEIHTQKGMNASFRTFYC